MSPELINTIATLVGIVVAVVGAFLFAFWIAMGIWTFNDIRSRSRDWLAILLACPARACLPHRGACPLPAHPSQRDASRGLRSRARRRGPSYAN